MEELARIIADNETRLVRGVLAYAKINDYVRYTSTLEQAWRLSIQGISNSLLSALDRFRTAPDFGPDDRYNGDPLTDFGLAEARRHRDRGITLTMFLGLFKYYKQSYIDLIIGELSHSHRVEEYRYFIERCFDRIEIAFCREWSEWEQSSLMQTLQTTARDMTNEKNVYLTVFESLADAVLLVDAEGTVLHMNHRASMLSNPNCVPGEKYHQAPDRIDGTAPDAPARDSTPGLHHQGDSLNTVFPWLVPYFNELTHGTLPSIASIVQATMNGDPRCFEINHSEMLAVTEKLTAHILTLRDVTERLAVEEKLSQRSLEIERLRQWESLGMLTSGLAHDFNNLLAVIAGRCRTVKKRIAGADKSVTEAMNHVLDAVDKGVGLIKTMRACSGREIHGTVSLDLSTLVDTWAVGAGDRLPPHVKLDVCTDRTLPKIPLNREQVVLILNQLFANALEAVGNNPGIVTIRTGAGQTAPSAGYRPAFFTDTGDGEFVYLEMQDTGEGIQDEILPQIFDPFFSTKFIGRGLGLAAVRGATAGHQGAVRIKTSPGEGSAFQILFPVHPEARQAVSSAPPM